MGPGALINNATDVRLTFRVPNEKLEEVLRTLLPNESIQPYMKGLTIGG